MSTTRNGPGTRVGAAARRWRPRSDSAPPPTRARPRARRRAARGRRRRTRRGCSASRVARRRDEPHALDAQLAAALRVLGGHGQRALQRLGREPPGAVDALAEPDDFHLALDVGQRPGPGVDVGDQQAHRVGAAVERRHPGHASSSVEPSVGLGRLGRARPARPPRRQRLQRLVAERVHAPDRRPARARPARAGTSPGSASRRRWCPRSRGRRRARPGGAGSPRARPGSAAARSGSSSSRSVISPISPDDSSVLIAPVSRGQVR